MVLTLHQCDFFSVGDSLLAAMIFMLKKHKKSNFSFYLIQTNQDNFQMTLLTIYGPIWKIVAAHWSGKGYKTIPKQSGVQRSTVRKDYSQVVSLQDTCQSSQEWTSQHIHPKIWLCNAQICTVTLPHWAFYY